MAAGAIQMNAGDAFICAGVESMSRVPMGGYNPMPHPGLATHYEQAYMAMGVTAENLAEKFNLSRQRQEELTVISHQRAGDARQSGRLADEIIPIINVDNIISSDGCIREGTTAEALADLKPVFRAHGSVTAATSSPLTDGASATLVTSEEYAKAHGLPILARIKSIAVAGCAPEIMGIGPVSATMKSLSRAGLSLSDIDIIELNDAVAAQALSCVDERGVDMEKTNIDGGALALGHPLGATGARITGKAAALLQREGKQFALAAQCIGGGQGIATILEAV
jgi:acetyl-CoA acyltransferase